MLWSFSGLGWPRFKALDFPSVFSFGVGTLLLLLSLALLAKQAMGQVEAPDKKYLFKEDRTAKKQEAKRKSALQKKRRQVAKQTKLKGFPFDVSATTINYDSQKKKITGEGGVILGYGSSIVEAERGEIDVENKQAEVSGDVRITDLTGNLSADLAHLKMSDGTGYMENADMYFEEGGYHILSKRMDKIGPETFTFDDTEMTTCQCEEEGCTLPWQIAADGGKITRDGYGSAWGAFIKAYDTPVMYVPYLYFPAKATRQTGFLPAQFGVSGRTGFNLQLPFFWAIDKATDMTLTPVLETKARAGLEGEFRKLFSSTNELKMGWMYFNESLRNGRSLGTSTIGIIDNATGNEDLGIPTNRFGGYLDGYFEKKLEGTSPIQLILEGRHVGDDLFLRELDRGELIAPYNTRYITSASTVRIPVMDTFTLEAYAEHNESMVGDDKTLLQTVPAVSLNGLHNFHPFGDNMLGAKLTIEDNVSYTNYTRSELYDGSRAEIVESFKVPFHFYNYFDGQFVPSVIGSEYSLNNTTEAVPSPGSTNPIVSELPSSSDRLVPVLDARLSSAVEKVFDVSPWNPLKFLTELGQSGRNAELVRLKHSIEPGVRYRVIPEVDQSDNPHFDSNDRLPRKNVVTYQLMQRFYGRFEQRNEYLYGMEEATPEVQDFGVLGSREPIDDTFSMGLNSAEEELTHTGPRGLRQELANFRIVQSYDFNQDQVDPSTTRVQQPNQFSDVGLNGSLLPNEYFRISAGTDLNPESYDFDDYNIGGAFYDKRGDNVRSKLTFYKSSVAKAIRQLETSAEVRLTNRLSFGYYAMYDDSASKFIEQKGGLRLRSSCNCWILDLQAWNRMNPDETSFMAYLTLKGLGEFGNSLFTQHRNAS